MKKDLKKIIIIPNGVTVEIKGNSIMAKGIQGEIKRSFKIKNIKIVNNENKIEISSNNATKKEKRMINTLHAHIKNIVNGVNEKFEYELKVCNSHFPMTVEYKSKDKIAIIKNFLGEKIPRKVKIPNEVNVDVNKDIIKISSINKELAGQTAANFEKSTFISLRDRRVFQDGIFITNKAGREI